MRKRDILEIVILLVLIIVLIIFIYKVQSDGSRCIVNPIKYTQNYYSDKNNASSECICSFDNPKLMNILANKTGTFNVIPSFKLI